MLFTVLQCGLVIGAGWSVIFLTFFRSVTIRSRGRVLFTPYTCKNRLAVYWTKQRKNLQNALQRQEDNSVVLTWPPEKPAFFPWVHTEAAYLTWIPKYRCLSVYLFFLMKVQSFISFKEKKNQLKSFRIMFLKITTLLIFITFFLKG